MMKTFLKLAAGLLALGATGAAMAAGAVDITQKQPLNVPALGIFPLLVRTTLVILGL